MTYRGTVRKGVVVLEPGAALPEGADVTVTAVEQPVAKVPTRTDPAVATAAPTVWQKLLEIEGAACGLPADLPERHDHYRRQRLKP